MRAGIGPLMFTVSIWIMGLPRASGDRPYGVKVVDKESEVAPCERG